MRSTSRTRPPPLRRRAGFAAVALLGALGLLAGSASAAQPPVGLGTADSFAVIAGSTVTNVGPSTIGGDVGVSPGSAITGFPPATVNGTVHVADGVAGQAQSDLGVAYVDAAGRTPAQTVTGDLGGLTLVGGVYGSASSIGLTGTLTLDAQGDPNTVFVFQLGSTLTTAVGSRVSLINGAQPCNVYWQVGSSATLGTTSTFAGTIMALTSVTIDNGVDVVGRALARNGAVTMIDDTIAAPHCAPGTTGGSDGGSGLSPVPGGTPAGTAPSGGSPASGQASPIGTPDRDAPKHQRGTALLTPASSSLARRLSRGAGACVRGGFDVAVRGHAISKVVFSTRGHVIATDRTSPFRAHVPNATGIRVISARISFTGGTAAVTRHLRYRACAAVSVRVPLHRSRPPQDNPPGFTG
jgi:Ice-binding-like